MSLIDVKKSVQKVAEAISAVLNIDVTIIDENYTRIASTGLHKANIGKRIPYKCLFESVAQNGKPEYNARTNLNEKCKSCSAKKTCREIATLGYPIILHKKVIGVIGINAYKENQKKYIERNYKNLVIFLERLSALIVGTLMSDKIIKELEIENSEKNKIIDSFDYGIICTNNKGIIKNINSMALKYLNLSRDEIKDNTNIKEIIHDTGLNKKSNLMIKNNHVTFEGENVSNIIEIHRTKDVVQAAYKLIEGEKYVTFDDIIGESKAIKEVKKIAKEISDKDCTVMLRGESGTGKELFARAIHFNSLRKKEPFITINCASIPDNLLESELFGYEGGAFSGSKKQGQIGKIELANGGTLFLDEIGDLPIHLQPKILRVLQEKSFRRIGGKKLINVDFRLITATNKDLEKMIDTGQFRRDLYYRINVIPIVLPPLRERREDILLLSNHFLKNYSSRFNTPPKQFSKNTKDILLNYKWKGNIRELENAIEYMVSMTKGDIITEEYVPALIKKDVECRKSKTNIGGLKDRLEQFEKQLLCSMLNRYGNSTQDKIKIAKELKINLSTLYRKIEKYNLQK